MKTKREYQKPALIENATFERRGVLAGCAVNAQTGSCQRATALALKSVILPMDVPITTRFRALSAVKRGRFNVVPCLEEPE